MAYREFRDEETYAAPETSGFLSHTISTIHNQLAEKARQKKANLTAAQRFKMDVGKAGYSSDQDALNNHAQQITASAIQELKNTGQLSSETALAMQDHESMLNKSLLDKKLADQVRSKIKEHNDNPKNYYNGKVDEEALMQAEYEGPISERQDRIQSVAKDLAGIKTFNKGKFVADHIQRQKLNKLQSVTDQSGVRTTKMTSAIFMKPDGTPGVTDNHVVEMFNEDPRVEQWYSKSVEDAIDNPTGYVISPDGKPVLDSNGQKIPTEVSRLKALGNDPRVAWSNGMSNDEIKAALIENPGLNVVNGTPFGQRKKELAVADLSAGQDLNKSTSVDYSDSYGVTGGKFNNTKIGYNPTVIEQSINSREIGGSRSTGTVGADLTFIDKGTPIKFVTNTPYRVNTGSGEVTTKASDNVELNLRNYGLYIYDNMGNLYPTSGKNLDEMKASIDGILAKHGTKVNLNPEMNIGLNGFVINKAKIGNQSLGKQSQLADEYNKAMDAGDEIKAQQINSRIEQLKKLSSMSNNIDVDDMDLLLTGKQLGISDIQEDMIIKAGDQDFAKLKSTTNGLDLRDKSKWTQDMNELNDYYKSALQKTRTVPQTEKKVEIKAKVSTAPKKGDKKGGYEFLGGDPAKPESWKKL